MSANLAKETQRHLTLWTQYQLLESSEAPEQWWFFADRLERQRDDARGVPCCAVKRSVMP